MAQTKEQKLITNMYAILTVSLLLTLVPTVSAAIMALIAFFSVWIGAYTLRSKSEQGDLVHDHMTFIIRTIWISGVFALVTMSIATAYILSVYDPSMMGACGANIPLDGSMEAMQAAVAPCMDEFMRINMPYFINGAIMAGVPLVIYLGYRLAKGVSRAVKGHRIGNLKSWF